MNNDEIEKKLNSIKSNLEVIKGLDEVYDEITRANKLDQGEEE